MSERKPRIYWDTNVWCEWTRNQFGQQTLCVELLTEADAGRLQIIISPLVIAEFALLDEVQDIKLQQYLQRSSFVRVAFSWPRATEARHLVRTHHGLGGMDAAHLACAIYARADFFHTFDGDANKGMLRFAPEFSNISICRPRRLGQMRLL